MQEERFWSAKETNKNTSFYSIGSSWYSSSHQTAQNANAWNLLYTRGAPVAQSLNSCPSTSCPQQSPLGEMLLEQDTFPAWEKSSCQLQPPVPPHTSTGLWEHPQHRKSCSQGRLKHLHGCTKELPAPQADQPAMTARPSGKNEILIPWKGCCGSGIAPAWQSRCPACPREASPQWRRWPQGALGSLLCNVQPKSRWFIPSNIQLQPTIILPHDGKCLFFPWKQTKNPSCT